MSRAKRRRQASAARKRLRRALRNVETVREFQETRGVATAVLATALDGGEFTWAHDDRGQA